MSNSSKEKSPITAHTWALLPIMAALSMPAVSSESAERFQQWYEQCRLENDPLLRLRCYDALGDSPTEVQTELDNLENGTATVSVPPKLAEQRAVDINRIEHLVRSEERGRLSADDPNYMVFASPMDDELGDENHVEFYLSLKYPLVDEWFDKRQSSFKGWESGGGKFFNAITPDRLLLHYNGLYDFYITDSNRYDSAPIVSRRQNPGISVEYDFGHGYDTLRIGWFHESNGQSMEQDDLLRFEALNTRFGPDYALAEVSRGWDYATVRWASSSQLFEDPLAEPWLNYQIETRFYCDCQGFGFIDDREDDIWWEPGNDDEISDYDGLRGMIEGTLFRTGRDDMSIDARLDLKTGLENSFAENWSGRLSLNARWDKIRVTMFYFDGYGRDPSTYHLRTKYTGIGLELR